MNIRAALILVVTSLVLVACGSGGGDDPAPTTPVVSALTLPLMTKEQLVGVIYSAPDATAKTTLDTSYAETLVAGVDLYQLSVTWSSLEPTPNHVDVSALNSLLTTVANTGLKPYLVIKTIDTGTLTIPSDLVDPAHADQLAAGVAFDSPAVLARFGAVLDQVAPLLVAKGGFVLSVGNEVDQWLGSHASSKTSFLNFVAAARTRSHALDARLAIAVTCTHAILSTDSSLFAQLLTRTDAACFTYYPVDSSMRVRDPSVVAADLAAMTSAAGDRYVLLQEAGYPSGYTPTPGNGSSQAQQAAFIDNLFAGLAAQTRIRCCSFLQLADYTAADVAGFTTYYGSSAPLFVEYLATLGLRQNTGSEKLAYQRFLAGLRARHPLARGTG